MIRERFIAGNDQVARRGAVGFEYIVSPHFVILCNVDPNCELDRLQ